MGKFVEEEKYVDPNKLWYIHGRAYDLKSFIHSHPGGPHALFNTQGRDCTALFESHHPFNDRARIVLSKMKEVKVPSSVLAERCEDTSNGDWFTLPDGRLDPFWEALRTRCGDYVNTHKMQKTMSWPWFIFSCLGCLSMFPLYYFLYLHPNVWISHAGAVVMAIVAWICGARMGHDGGHFAISRKHWINRLWSHLGGMWLSNASYWELLHNILHHSFTNTEADPDMFHYVFFLRDTTEYPYFFFHRLQGHRLWCLAVWSFTSAGLLIFEPLMMLLTGSGTHPGDKIQKITTYRTFFWVKMVVHLLTVPVVGYLLPLYVCWDTQPNHWVIAGQRFGSFVVYMSLTGVAFGINSQVNHFSRDCVSNAKKNSGWAQRQVETAGNFVTGSFWHRLFTAGLNLQIEHHLFPAVASDQLVPLVPIIQQTCKEFGVDYKEFSSFRSIFASTMEYMDTLTAPRETVPALA